jgi:hypothetical protein
VTSVSITPGNGFNGTVVNPTTTPAIEISTTISGILKGSAGALTAATPGVDYAPATSGTSILKGNGSGGFANAAAGTDYLTNVGLTMPAAFSVPNSPLTANGTLNVTAVGTAAQYIRGDGQLAILPTSGGGGTTTNYYLNGSVASSVVGYEQMSKTPVIGAGTDFTLTNTSGYIASFLTDAGDPSLLNIPAGAWEFNLFLQSSNGSGSPTFYVELYKYDGTTFTPLGTSSTEPLNSGTFIQYYSTSIGIGSTALSITDRIAVRIHVNTAGSRTITLHTEDSHLCQVVTTFATGITSLNGLNATAQFFANGSSGLAPAFVSSTSTHTLNIPLASTASVTAGLISNTDYTTFSNKISNPMTALGDVIYGGTVVGGVATPTALGIGSPGQVLGISAGIPAWVTAGAGDVTSTATGSPQGNFAIFNDNTGKVINTSSVATLGASPSGRATFNNGVDVGVSSSTTGTLVFRSSVNAGLTIIQAAGSPSATDIFYYLPSAQATGAGQILANDGSGNLQWTSAGAGNMILASTQTNTGAKTFNSGTLLLGGSSSGTTTLNASATAAGTVTLPALTGTVALLEQTQTFTGAKTFAGTGGTITFSRVASAGSAITISGTGTNGTPQVAFTGATMNWMSFGTLGASNPSVITRSSGTKIALGTYVSESLLDYAIGLGSGTLWMSLAQSTDAFQIWAPISSVATNIFQLSTSAMTFNGSSITLNTNTTSTNVTGSQANGIISRNFINFGTGGGVALPAAVGSAWSTRSLGSRLIVQSTGTTTEADMAIGYNTNVFWYSLFRNNTNNQFSWYGATTEIMRLGGTGILNLSTSAGRLQINSTQVVGTQISGYGTPTNGNRTLSFAAVSQAEQVLAQLIADLKTHGLIA